MAIVEERCYVLKPEYVPKDYFEAYEQLGRKVQTETLGGLLGFYATEIGELNAVVSLWHYESFEDRQVRRARLAGLSQWQEYLNVIRPMLSTMSNRLLAPAPFMNPRPVIQG